MIERMADMPESVLAFSGSGQITSHDYETVVIPAVEALLARQAKARVLFHLQADFSGFDAGAMWDDARMGLSHPTAWERVALVTDEGWLKSAVRMLGFVLPGHVRVFETAELAQARDWIVEDLPAAP